MIEQKSQKDKVIIKGLYEKKALSYEPTLHTTK